MIDWIYKKLNKCRHVWQYFKHDGFLISSTEIQLCKKCNELRAYRSYGSLDLDCMRIYDEKELEELRKALPNEPRRICKEMA
jgi:hypothetical protein